jgi:hypothetical protein
MQCILCEIIFLESFSQVLIFDMHFYMHSYLHKNFYSCKKWVLQYISSSIELTCVIPLYFAASYSCLILR